MVEIRHRVGIRGVLSDIFRALAEPRLLEGWWATRASGQSAQGEMLELGFGQLVTLSFQVRELIENSLVELECISGPNHWRGSVIRFSLEGSEVQVFLTLTHSNQNADEESFL
jgi:hypothetical protein